MSSRANAILIQALGFCRDAQIVEEERTELNLATPDQQSFQQGIGARVIHEGRVGYAWSQGSISDTALLKEAILNARTGPAGSFNERGAFTRPLPASAITDLNGSLKKSLLAMQGLIKGLEFYLPSLLPDRSFQLQARLLAHSLCLTTSAGTRQATRILHFLALKSNDYPSVCGASYATAPPSDPSLLLSRLAWRTVHSRDVAWPEGQTLPAVFTAEACGSLLEDFAGSALTLPAPDSYFSEVPLKQGWLHPEINIADDGTIPGAFGTTLFDGDGIIRQKRPLIQNGMLCQRLADLTTCKALSLPVPGLAVRRWGQVPSGGYSNLILEPGERSLGELCAQMDYGLLLDKLTPVAPSLQRPGVFTRRAHTAFIVQDGRPVCRIPQLLVRAKFEDLFGAAFVALGFEQELQGRTLAPPLAVSGVELEESEPNTNEDWANLPGLWW